MPSIQWHYIEEDKILQLTTGEDDGYYDDAQA